MLFLPGLALGTMPPLEQSPYYSAPEPPATLESVADEMMWHRVCILVLAAIQGVTTEQLNKLAAQHLDVRWWRPKGPRRA